LLDEIVCFNINDQNYFERVNKENKMLPIQMRRGSGEELYFCEESQTGTHQICMLTFEKEAATKTVIYEV